MRSLSHHIPLDFIHPRLVCSININIDVICSHSYILYECKGEKSRLQNSDLRRLGLMMCRVCLDFAIFIYFYAFFSMCECILHRCIVLVVVHDSSKNLSSYPFHLPGIQLVWLIRVGDLVSLGSVWWRIPSLPNPPTKNHPPPKSTWKKGNFWWSFFCCW